MKKMITSKEEEMAETKNVNVVPGGTTPVIHVSQGDIGRQIVLNITDGSGTYDLTGCTVTIAGTKPSGLGFSKTGTVSGSTVTIVTNKEMTGEYGSIACELKITKNQDKIGTANMILAVERDPHPDGTTDGLADDLIPALTLLVERVEAAVAKEEVLHEAEAWAVGERDGVPVDEDDDTYHNNSKWYADQAALSETAASASEHTASEKASQAAASASSAGTAKTDAEAAAAEAAASAEAAAAVFAVVGNVAFSVLPNGQVRETWTEEE